MATVFIPAQLQDLTRGTASVGIEATTVREIVHQLEAHFPGIRARLCDGDDLVSTLQVSVDDEISTRGLYTRVEPDSEVHFLPALGGG